jgi:hypothetical protein
VAGERPALAGVKGPSPAGLVVDAHAFGQFYPLLEASQRYAKHTGYRFSGFSFEALSLEPPTDGSISGDAWKEGDLILSTIHGASPLEPLTQHLLAELEALPTARLFQARLRAGETALLADLAEAFHVVMEEGARNSMIARCASLGLWPPQPGQVLGISGDDCSYLDTSVRLPVIAQRLFNDERRRRAAVEEVAGADVSTGDWARQRASIASFITDFAVEAGIPMPPVQEDIQRSLHEFNVRATEWEQQVKVERQSLWQKQALSNRKFEHPRWEAADVVSAGRLAGTELKSMWTRISHAAFPS